MKEQVPVSEGLAAEALKGGLGPGGNSLCLWRPRPPGFDCSGLIVWSYRQTVPDLQLRWAHRIAVDVNMDELWRYNVLPLGILDLRPGDLVFIASEEDRITHGGLFVRWVREGELELVNASSYAGGGHLGYLAHLWDKAGTMVCRWGQTTDGKIIGKKRGSSDGNTVSGADFCSRENWFYSMELT